MNIKYKILWIIHITLILGACNNIKKDYYESGQLKSRVKVQKGIRNGKSEYFYENGQRSKVFNYENDERNGPYKIYYENGALCKEGIMLNDTLDGLFIEYSDKGDTLIKRKHNKGNLEIDILYRQGKPLRIIDYVNGYSALLDKDGNVVRRIEIEP